MYPSNKKKKVWREEKERLLKMTLEERRKEYIRDYVSLSTILSWKEEMKSKGQNDEENAQEAPQVKKSLSEKVSLYRGDITLLEVDAIVNADEIKTKCFFTDRGGRVEPFPGRGSTTNRGMERGYDLML
uniref:mono-ADP ribosylhydrolase 2 isoform 6 n=1 Tax=Rattus norvegicus TaxID=10116 RepID=UPI00264576FB